MRGCPVSRLAFAIVGFLSICVPLWSTGNVTAAELSRPFPYHQVYKPGSIKPNHVSQATLDRAVADHYDQWKAGFLRNDCGDGQYYVWYGDDEVISVSEGHGYGMIITALMAGHDPEAKAIFDGLHAFFRAHPSEIQPELMAWRQLEGCVDSEDADSASDGDLDIAYALLLADRQWGSAGAINYLGEAKRVLGGIKAAEISPSYPFHVQLGDWVDPGQPTTFNAARTSDWMPAHFQAFGAVSGRDYWAVVRTRSYELLAATQKNFASTTGLVPDFILNAHAKPTKAPANFLGNDAGTGDKYGWNACRVPWRIAVDFLLNGETRARTAVGKMEDFFVKKTSRRPDQLRAVYTLAGKPVTTYSDLAFTAPIGVGAMVDKKYQTWLNAIWDNVTTAGFEERDYYGNTLRLLSMLVMSGNWWGPA